MFILILLNVQTKHCVHFNIILSKIWVNMRKKQIVNAKPKNEHMILNNFFRPLHIFPMLLGHQETLPKHSHHSSSQSIQFPENRHICLKTGQVILNRCQKWLFHFCSCLYLFKKLILDVKKMNEWKMEVLVKLIVRLLCSVCCNIHYVWIYFYFFNISGDQFGGGGCVAGPYNDKHYNTYYNNGHSFQPAPVPTPPWTISYTSFNWLFSIRWPFSVAKAT